MEKAQFLPFHYGFGGAFAGVDANRNAHIAFAIQHKAPRGCPCAPGPVPPSPPVNNIPSPNNLADHLHPSTPCNVTCQLLSAGKFITQQESRISYQAILPPPNPCHFTCSTQFAQTSPSLGPPQTSDQWFMYLTGQRKPRINSPLKASSAVCHSTL